MQDSTALAWRGAAGWRIIGKTSAGLNRGPLPPAPCSPLQGYGVYRFENKYGANVDGYSPIYTPDQWTDDGQVRS